MNNQSERRVIVSFIVTDLVKNGVIGRAQTDNKWMLGVAVAGLEASTVFDSREQMLDRLTTAYTTWLDRVGGLKVAG